MARTGCASGLLAELVSSAWGEWLQRQEAMSRLLEHPDADSHAVVARIDLASAASSPVAIEPISLLDVADQADGNAYILHQIVRSDDPRILQGAFLGSPCKISNGHFRDRQWTQPIRQVIGRLNDTATD